MSYVAERRGEEKQRRRTEILDAAESLYTKKGWDAVTVDQVARRARLSRALVYVYFRDKEDLLFAIGERAMRLLRDRFAATLVRSATGLERIEAIGRAYMQYARDFPHYFDFCTRFQSHSVSPDPTSNEGACQAAGDAAIGIVVQAIESGIRDGTVRADLGKPMQFAITLWGFTHGTIQLAMAKGPDLARMGIAVPEFTEYAFAMLRDLAKARPSE